jgi:hypothetical protein
LLRTVDEDLAEFRDLLRRGIVDQIKNRKHLPELRG